MTQKRKDVGYKNPPKEHQFKRGKSGNPKGRPKGRKNAKPQGVMLERFSESALMQSLFNAARAPVDFIEHGEQKQLPTIDLAMKALFTKAIKGNASALKLVMEFLMATTRRADATHFQFTAEWTELNTRKDQLEAHKPGSLAHFEVLHKLFSFKDSIRRIEGPEPWPWETGEPMTMEDQAIFLDYLEKLRSHRITKAPWPLDYMKEALKRVPAESS